MWICQILLVICWDFISSFAPSSAYYINPTMGYCHRSNMDSLLKPPAHYSRPKSMAACLLPDGGGSDLKKYQSYARYQSDKSYCGYRSWIDDIVPCMVGYILYDSYCIFFSIWWLVSGRRCCILGHTLRIHNTAFQINEYESGNEYYYWFPR